MVASLSGSKLPSSLRSPDLSLLADRGTAQGSGSGVPYSIPGGVAADETCQVGKAERAKVYQTGRKRAVTILVGQKLRLITPIHSVALGEARELLGRHLPAVPDEACLFVLVVESSLLDPKHSNHFGGFDVLFETPYLDLLLVLFSPNSRQR